MPILILSGSGNGKRAPQKPSPLSDKPLSSARNSKILSLTIMKPSFTNGWKNMSLRFSGKSRGWLSRKDGRSWEDGIFSQIATCLAASLLSARFSSERDISGKNLESISGRPQTSTLSDTAEDLSRSSRNQALTPTFSVGLQSTNVFCQQMNSSGLATTVQKSWPQGPAPTTTPSAARQPRKLKSG